MNYSDENQQGLMSLLAASQSGLDPATAYTMLQNIQSQQEAQNQQRMDRQSGLLGMLQEAAMSGMPYEGAQAMLDAAPGPMGPALQAGLSAAYPSGGPPPTNASGAQMDFPVGSRLDYVPQGVPGPAAQNFVPTAPTSGPQATSPMFVPEQPSPTEQQAMMEMQQQDELQGELSLVQQDAAAARAQEWTVDDFIAKSQTENPDLWAQAPEEMMQIVENTFGAAAVDMRGVAI